MTLPFRSAPSTIGTTGTLLAALLLAACSSSDEPRTPKSAVATLPPGEALAKKVKATKAEVTGAFTVRTNKLNTEFSIGGSYDLSSGDGLTDFSGGVADPGSQDLFVLHRRVVSGSAFIQYDEYEDSACWIDVSKTGMYGAVLDGKPEVIALLESLKGVKRVNTDEAYEATVPVGALRDVLFGVWGKRKVAATKSERATRVPVFVRTGKGLVQGVTADMAEVLAVLDAKKIKVEDVFELGARTAVEDLGIVKIDLTAFGLPIVVDRPAADEISTDLEADCAPPAS